MPQADAIECPPPFVAAPEMKQVLTNAGLIWVRKGEAGRQDMNVVNEVIANDGYFTRLRGHGGPECVVADVGAHIGSFARLWRQKNPSSRIACVEACPENIPVLSRNVHDFIDATILHAACTYEAGDVALLNSCMPGGTATGGSTVLPREAITDESKTFGHLYWRDARTLPKVTLETVMQRLGVDWIDVLKLDCEGSEFSILEHGPMDRVGFIFGEYHGWERFDELRRRKFADWDFGHMHASSDGLGIFHLVNPRGSKV